ncbi:CubicO group peptidase, beta-lactamase class C family [Mucilaginibacter lappiensis]|uniref:CubicO group peptidase (Beta-lactamase class C family) n=1 Tax=Mucilaginibacter lappiensis TaxID=354630 RepID=A0ABR6PFF3_9SPHI|nr:serine hydrolase domain-containing protein [Mucilaginibacter lappiensis]MBB6108477.1 CubicO group peptidase (beta-lactamase class C family) [Mucilaginibacter lappiensis]SIQ36474.1 CubicO group peptidase, beta-lactamase class C family [Mucilaginibacter lappiensis]
MKPFITAAFFYLCFVCLSAGAQDKNALLSDNKLKSRMDSAVDLGAKRYMDTPNTIGLSIGIYKGGKTYTYNYGEIKRGSGQLPNADNFYNLGSVAKTFVTTMLAEAVIEKKVSLHDDIRKYLPGNYPNLAFNGHPIRLVDLANHTSGLPGTAHIFQASVKDSVRKLSLPDQLHFYNVYKADSLLKDLHRLTPDTIPGTKYRYNGNGMMVLILLLERIYHKPYEQLVTHYLKTHLDMADTKTQIVITSKRLAQGYDRNNKPQPYLNLVDYYNGPSMNSTIHDMLKYIKANLAEQDPAIKLIHQPTWKDAEGTTIGLGWMIDTDYKGTRIIYHDGHTGIGFNTLCLFYPGKDLGYIIIVNDNISQQRLFDLQKNVQQHLDQ